MEYSELPEKISLNLRVKHFVNCEMKSPTNCPIAIALKEYLNNENLKVNEAFMEAYVDSSQGRQIYTHNTYFSNDFKQDWFIAAESDNEDAFIREVVLTKGMEVKREDGKLVYK